MESKMSDNMNQTYAKSAKKCVNKRTFAWIGFEDIPNEDSVNNENIESIESNPTKSRGLGWIAFDDSGDDNIPEPPKKAKEGLTFIPFGQNSGNVFNEDIPNDFTFSVPERLPPKLKHKLTPSKITPARRPSQGSSSSLRRTTFKVTPRPVTYLGGHNLSRATITKKRRSSGSSSMKTPKNKLSVLEFNTPFTCGGQSSVAVEEIQYMSWINTMLAPKGDDKSDRIDSNQLIIECFNSSKVSLSECPTKERMSLKAYQESVKWNQLRTTARALYRSEDVQKINRKIISYIENNKFAIRRDRAVHADTGIRKHILDLLLSYNPLWLRIGLETLYNQKIEMSSNGMKSSLGQFIAQNLLVSKELMAKYGHKTNTHFFRDDKHITEAKEYILTKFLLLLNWLDIAKQKGLIQHNPCLFRIGGQFKSTLELIISFARDYITGVGDITKYLTKYIGFSMTSKQTAIEEFNFEANNLAVDLRCGIRLTRLAELVTDNNGLLSKLLYPADNITRKLHNVKTALDAFGDIAPKGIIPKDIVMGHRKKTFELLDAIIFKYKTDMILLEDQMREQSVITIQRWFRANRLMREEKEEFEKLKYFTIILQKRFRENKAQRMEKREQLRLKKTVIMVQRKFRANRVMRIQRQSYEELRLWTIRVQTIFRANRLMRAERHRLQLLKRTTIWIQRQFRANRAMRTESKRFEKLKFITILVQRKFRANRDMKIESKRYEALRRMTIWVQTEFRANRLMRTERDRFQLFKRTTIWIQRQFRANRAMRTESKRFEKLKFITILVQRKFRANRDMKIESKRYEELRRMTIRVQTIFKANRLMRAERHRLQLLKRTTIWIQRQFKANRAMRTERKRFENLKFYTILVQRKFRANRDMKIESKRYEELRRTAIWVQTEFRANRLMRTERDRFQLLKRTTIWIQRQFRANRAMRTESKRFEKLKFITILVQRKFRANRDMKFESKRYEELRRMTIWVQNIFRANRLMRTERDRFRLLKGTTIWTQRRFRANRAMRTESKRFENLKFYTILVQRKFRANRDMKIESKRYEELRRTTVWVQTKFRANRLMRTERDRFQLFKRTTIWIQRHFRANRAVGTEKLKAVLLVQRRFRANRLMKVERERFGKLKFYTIVVQKQFRERLVDIRNRRAVIKIQSLWRGYRTRKRIHENDKKVETAFRRILTTTSLATEDMLLGNRTFNALHRLLAYDSLLLLAKDLDSLDNTTQLSADSCETIANNGAVDILIQILDESNRSEPHKQIVILSISILLNLAKFEKTLPKLISNSRIVEILFKIIRSFSRENVIICKSITLLWILMQNQSIFENVLSNKRKLRLIKEISEHLKKDKAFKKYKIKSNYKFWPKWQIAKSNAYQFDNHFIAIKAIAHRMKIE